MASQTETQASAEELRAALNAVKKESGQSWSEIAQQSGIPSGTISQWAAGKYQGDSLRVASDVRRFLDARASLAALKAGAIENPGFIETATARRFLQLYAWAHSGEIVAIAAGPGTGKTEAAREYQTRASNVWLATMAPSSSGVQPMQITVLSAMGVDEARGSPQQLSARVLAKVRGSRGLVIIDEAQELSEKALDEVRSWHDETGVGIALVGDERVIGRLGGLRRRELARLHSRVSMRHIQAGPTAQDAEAVARGWGISAADQLKFLRALASKPGGLRGITKVIKLAALLAADEGRALALDDLRAAWSQLNTDLTVAG
jgi:DNA transposition AAA+ family ATPase